MLSQIQQQYLPQPIQQQKIQVIFFIIVFL